MKLLHINTSPSTSIPNKRSKLYAHVNILWINYIAQFKNVFCQGDVEFHNLMHLF